MSAAQGTCIYCGREMWLPGLEPCCGKAEHAGRLVCADVRGCVGVVLARLHDQPVDNRLMSDSDLPIVLSALSAEPPAAPYSAAKAATGVPGALGAIRPCGLILHTSSTPCSRPVQTRSVVSMHGCQRTSPRPDRCHRAAGHGQCRTLGG
jgi:hypothetical protein